LSKLTRFLIKDFINSSWLCLEKIVERLTRFEEKGGRGINLFCYKNGRQKEIILNDKHFFLRSSVEYSNPQLTVEEVQGIIAARFLEVCGNYFYEYGLHKVDRDDINEIYEVLNNPPQGMIYPFLLNTDETEPDRYSMNPLKESIVNSGQSSFPSATVKTENLKIDNKFIRKYEGVLISRKETELIEKHLENCGNNYLDMVDSVKYDQLETLSKLFGINLCIFSLRMPLTILEREKKKDFLHQIISESHKDQESIRHIYSCMGRSLKKRKTLLTIPHSEKGYGSKRAVRGKLYFEGEKLKSIKIKYRTTNLYPNAIDPDDVSIAKADDCFSVGGEKFVSYNFTKVPSSPQFILYSLGSPEKAVIWHGIGAFGAMQLVNSYTTLHQNNGENSFVRYLKEALGSHRKIPIQFNLAPMNMWVHPIHRNIDASIGSVNNLTKLVKMGMKIEYLENAKMIR
jgi:hypothetical protein